MRASRSKSNGSVAAAALALALGTSCRESVPAEGPAASAAGAPASPGWLKGTTDEKIRSVEAQLRGLDVAMVEIGHRFAELYFAGQDRNWDYAKYQADKVRLALELALERRPKRAASARPFLDEELPALVRAIEAKDTSAYREAMERLRAGCMKCHVAESVPFFTVHFPENRVSVIRPE